MRSPLATFVIAWAAVFVCTFLVATEWPRLMGRDRLTLVAGKAGGGRAGGLGAGRRRLRGSDRRRLEEQIESLAVLMGGAVASGQTVVQALESCAGDVPDAPLGPEIRRVVDEYRVGTPILASLSSMSERLAHPDLDYLVRIIEIHMLSGGEFGGVLENVVNTLRQRRSLRLELKAGCAEARISAAVVAALPVVLAAFTFATRPEMLLALGRTVAGRLGVAYAVASWLCGLCVLRMVSRIDFV
ncbi:MAG: type II secretion system F family protein [Firmicutes bacterium]|nr:type II secretion system F family protein [Bacillota bacterium]